VVFGGAALLVSTLVIGGVFRSTQAVVAAIVACALLTQIASRRKLDRVSPIVLLLGIAIAMTAVQLLPLPAAMVAFLDPTNAALRTDGAAIAHTAPWSCLSMDFANTLRGLTYLITLLGVALVSLRLSASDRGRFLLVGGVALACGLVALVTALHSIVNAERIYGIYDVPAVEPVLGPFVNSNHFGCLMALGTTLSIGLAFYEKQTAAWRAVWVVNAAGCASMALLSESRGAAVSLALGVIVTSALLVSRRLGDVARGPRARHSSAGRLPIVVVLTLGFGLAVYSSAGGVAEQLGKTSLIEVEHPVSKFAAWKASAQLVRESPWVGVGRGAVEPVFTHAFPASSQATFGHLENEYIEAVVEWGIPGALLLAVALGWCIVTGLRKWRDGPLAAAALGAIAGVMFQSSVDFGIELLGVAVPVTIVASTLQLVPLRETSRFGALRVVRAVIILALALAPFALLSDRTSTLDEDHDAMMAGDYKTPEELAPVIQRHPLDYFAFGIAGQNLMADHDARAATFLNHALRLHPYQPGLHRFVARLLIAIGARAQAALEYSLAMNGAPPHLLLKEIVAVLPAPDDAAAAIPLDYPVPASIWTSLAELHRDDVAERWLVRRTLDRPTQDLELLDTLYDLALSRTDYDVALRAARARFAIANTPTSRAMIARILYAQKQYTDVYAELADVESWPGNVDDRADAWLLVCDSYRDQRRWDDAMRCIHKLDGTGSMAVRRQQIIQRESAIRELRESEIRSKQIQGLERSLNLPLDDDLPVSGGSGADGPIQNPLGSPPIQNPIHNPLDPVSP
jgi:O-antigen ligase